MAPAAGEPMPLGYESYAPPADYPVDDLAAALQYDLDRLPALLGTDDLVLNAWGLEGRAPFTDQRIFDYALALPLGRRARGRQTARHFGTKRQHPSFGSQRTQPVADNPLALTVVTHRLTQQASTHQHLVHAGLTHASAPCIT